MQALIQRSEIFCLAFVYLPAPSDEHRQRTAQVKQTHVLLQENTALCKIMFLHLKEVIEAFGLTPGLVETMVESLWLAQWDLYRLLVLQCSSLDP